MRSRRSKSLSLKALVFDALAVAARIDPGGGRRAEALDDGRFHSALSLLSTAFRHEFRRLNSDGCVGAVELLARSRRPKGDNGRLGLAKVLQEAVVKDDGHDEDGGEEDALGAPAVVVANLEERR